MELEVWDTCQSALEGSGTYGQQAHRNTTLSLKYKMRGENDLKVGAVKPTENRQINVSMYRT